MGVGGRHYAAAALLPGKTRETIEDERYDGQETRQRREIVDRKT